MTSFIGYARVSTSKQQSSGLGLASQKSRIAEFAGNSLTGLFIEVEGGGNNERPELEKALLECELSQSTLVVASLCRLSRNVAFLETVKARCEAGNFGFRCVDMPDANSFMLGVMAQLAQFEREQISARTKAALAAAKAKGTVLGNPQGSKAFKGRQAVGVANAATVNRTTADDWAEKRRPILIELVAAGLSLSAMARELSSRGISTRRGGAWTAQAVSNLIGRLALAPAAATA